MGRTSSVLPRCPLSQVFPFPSPTTMAHASCKSDCTGAQWIGLGLLLLVALAPTLLVSPAAAAQAPDCDLSRQQSVVINFFIHDDLNIKPTGSSFTTVPALSTVNGATNTNLFGEMAVLDDAVTEGPNVTSKLLARGRGFYVFDYLLAGSTSLEFVWTAIFTNESGYGGSTLTFRGYDNIGDEYRELAITGGTGEFRLARGWAGLTTFSLNGGAAILNTTCYVYYGCKHGVALSAPGGSSSASHVLPPLIIILNIALCSAFLRTHHLLFRWEL